MWKKETREREERQCSSSNFLSILDTHQRHSSGKKKVQCLTSLKCPTVCVVNFIHASFTWIKKVYKLFLKGSVLFVCMTPIIFWYTLNSSLTWKWPLLRWFLIHLFTYLGSEPFLLRILHDYKRTWHRRDFLYVLTSKWIDSVCAN